MIPKVLHYCWYGGKNKTKLIDTCIQSWKKCLPDYEIIEWNEKNTDLNHPYVKVAYQLEKWAFVSDFIRLKVLYEIGGIYLDTDMMIIKSIDELLNDSCFFGAEEKEIISAGIIASEKGHPFIKACLENYNLINLDVSTNFHELVIPILITKTYIEHFGNTSFEKITKVNNVVVYPESYFYPFPNNKKNDIKNYKDYIQKSTYAIHFWNASWVAYDEFYYLRNKKYFLALRKMSRRIFFKRDINLYYFKRIYLNFLKSI